VIVRAKFIEFRTPAVDGYAPLYDFEVMEVIAGDLDNRFVSLWGQDGANCNGPVIELSEEGEYIVMFPSTEGYSSAYAGLSGGIENRYPIYDYPGCGTSTLQVLRQTISGQIAEGVNDILKSAFYELLEECTGVEVDIKTPGFGELYNSYEATIRPNPASDNFIIDFDTAVPVFAVSLYDALGRLISNDQLGGVETTSHQVNVANLPSGVYNLVVGTDGVRIKKRIVVR